MTKLIAVSARDNWDSLSRLERLLREKANAATGMESEIHRLMERSDEQASR